MTDADACFGNFPLRTRVMKSSGNKRHDPSYPSWDRLHRPTKANADPAPKSPGADLLESTFLQVAAERLLAQRLLADLLRPVDVRCAEVSSRHGCHGIDDAAIGEEVGEEILVAAIGRGGIADLLRHFQSALLPHKAAPHGPGE